MSYLSVGGLQLEIANGNNLDQIIKEIKIAKERFPWLQMIVIPELALFGSEVEFAEPLPGHTEQSLQTIAQELGIWLLPGSMMEKSGSNVYNTMPVINPEGEVISRYRKIFPFQPFEEGVTPGNDFCVFPIKGIGQVGVMICYDLWFPEVARALVWLGAEVIICPSMTNTIDRDAELAMARATAIMNQCYVVNMNCDGRMGNGQSVITGPDGNVICKAGSGHEVLAVDLDLNLVRRFRERGMHSQAQTLKSFRDSNINFPQYQRGHASSPAMQALGELKKPAADENPE